jgi:dTDP-4-dehydrorhamnose reductase
VRVLVTGGRGFVAGEVAAAARDAGWAVEAPSRQELDVTDAAAVAAAVHGLQPDVVVHTAYRERDPGLREVTVGGTASVAAACAMAGVRMVHVSSDMVFDGRTEPWAEADERCPLTAYGRAKADAEAAVERAMAGSGLMACIVRTSLVLAGPDLPPGRHERAVLDVLDGRADMVFFTDEIRRPVLVRDLATAVVRVAAMEAPPPVVHVAGPAVMSRIDLARLVAAWHQWDASALRSAPTASVRLAEPRPGRVVLDIGLAVRLGLVREG